MISFTEDIQLLNLELFDAAFAVKPGAEDEVKRRFMTLLVSESGRHRGGSADVRKAHNLAGETFALKCLHTQKGTPATGGEALPSPPAAVPTRRVLRNSSTSSGTPSSQATPDYVTAGHVAAFYEEYRIHLSVSHLRGFPRLYGFGLAEGSPVLVMEWVEGVTLRDALRERTRSLGEPLPLTSVASLGEGVLRILERAEELDERFVHRDLSPRNIMLRTDRIPAAQQLASGVFDLCLVDLGSATLQPSAQLDATFTLDSSIWRMGTPAYAPPEMLTSDVPLSEDARQSPTIDVYALCSVLYELYGGSTPFVRAAGDGRSAYRLKTETTAPPLVPREPDGGMLAACICAGITAAQAERPRVVELERMLASWRRDPSQTSVSWRDGEQDGDTASPGGRLLTRRRLVAGSIVALASVASGAIVGSSLLRSGTRTAALDASRYARADELYQGEPLFVAYDGELRSWLLCTAAGEIACKPSSSRACGALREGLVSLYDDLSQLVGYVTPTNTTEGYGWAILPAFAQADDFSDGLAAAQDATSRLWGYVDTTGSWALPAQLSAAGRFSHGAAAACDTSSERLWGALDDTGAWLIPPRFATLGTRSAAGLAVAEEKAGSWGIVDEEGSWTSATRHPLLRRFAGGRAPARSRDTGRWGFVDKQGAWAIDPVFRDARPFYRAEGQWLAAVQDAATQLWYLIESDGEPHDVMQPRFWKLGDLHDGLAPAQARPDDDVVVFDEDDPDAYASAAGMRYGYVDHTGSWQMRGLTELTSTAIGTAEI